MKKRSKAKAITLRTVLQHLQHVKNVLTNEIRDIRIELSKGIQDVHMELKALDKREDNRHRMIMTALQNIDERLDDIEIKRLPRLEEKILSQ